jgi:AcrR family transcriptional regulator
MDATMRGTALQAFREHMDQFDWSTQSGSRRKILQAFLRLATQHGFNAVSMRMIASEVNVKAPSLYAHFPDGRDEIVAESLRWHFYRFGVALIQAVENTRTAEEYWDAMVKLHFTRQVALPESNLWDLLVAADSMLHFLATDLRAEVDIWLSLHESMYVSAAADMGCKDPESPVRVVIALLESSTRWIPAEPLSESDLEPLADRAAALSKSVLRLSV